MKPNRRIAQVNELLREEIGKILISETSDPVLMAMTVTEVRTSPDLSSAKVFIMCRQFGESEEIGTVENMDYAAEIVQKKIGSRIRLKKTPHLHFVVDQAEEQASRIEDLLNQVKDDLQDNERDSEC
ncbi:MAG: 30S ribosome-binding factor RbfA [Candidatus Omnitrophica bacterium]|nr:30S ribosome-binding factor RbfA [Candidatus Omnitrophota bacterium]MCA9444535.1 30S ribosome-binding factor RbfA [Candidatus Omnitrophota bacterium]MCB9767796.1 30S ribosome-binding factor RbfA [Candidatus Omnitrophota bacterium]MCB9781965.1 30S ribosome-binding factor RbfA [Candidatus Omnitrophota bacterium]